MGANLDRWRNGFMDPATGRRLHVIFGRPRGGSPTMRTFAIRKASYDRLAASPDPWVALAPSGSASFALLPLHALRWRASGPDLFTTARFDAQGELMDTGIPGPGEGCRGCSTRCPGRHTSTEHASPLRDAS